MMWNGGAGWGWGVLMMFVWVAVILAIVLLVIRSSSRDARSDRKEQPDPDQILAERFARGEIDAEEYQRRREVLQRRG